MRPREKINRNILPKIGELQRTTYRVRMPRIALAAIPKQMENEPPDGIGRKRAIRQQIPICLVAMGRHIHAKSREQIPEQLHGQIVHANRFCKRRKYRTNRI